MRIPANASLLLLVLSLTVTCSRPTAPDDKQGAISLALLPGSDGPLAAAQAIDSIAVRVFRPGPATTFEVAAGTHVGAGPAELEVRCIAESGKRVSVEIFSGNSFYLA